MSKLRKQTVSCIFILLTLSLLITCEDPNSPFSNNLGEKVVVEPPTINIEIPRSKSFIRGTEVHIQGIATAYIALKKIEMRILSPLWGEDTQWFVVWESDNGSALKEMTWSYNINTQNYNHGEDGYIKIIARVYDSTPRPVESIEYQYTIKNYPPKVIIANPSRKDIIFNNITTIPAKPVNLNYRGEIRGQITDAKGLRPGFPQIKIWPGNDPEPTDDPNDASYDKDKSWASLFLARYDDIDAVGSDGKLGVYADRANIRVVKDATFSFRLAKFEVDAVNDEIRKIRYDNDGTGKHVPFGANTTWKFRIRTKDTNYDLESDIPTDDEGSLVGYFPPQYFGEDLENPFEKADEPVWINIFSSDARPLIEINNDDIINNPLFGPAALEDKPNHYITEPTSKKIALNAAGKPDFRLRLLVTMKDNAPIDSGTLRYEGPGGKSGDLNWDNGTSDTGESNDPPYGDGNGTVFTFTAMGNMGIFTSNPSPYTLIFTVKIGDQLTEKRYVVYMDGEPPNVSIRSVRGAAAEPAGAAAAAYGGLINDKAYTVNGNIQVVVDRTDDSGIMAYSSANNMGSPPPDGLDGYPMVKWIVQLAAAGDTEPASTGTVLESLINYKNDPSALNLQFFNNIEEDRGVYNTEVSGWVKRPITGTDIAADRSNHFKLNTLKFDGQYLWLYVIAMDQVQNLGFVAQKIYVDQNTDLPRVVTPALFTTNASDVPAVIVGPEGLDIDVTVSGNTRTKSGNWSASSARPPRNILERGQGIELNLIDDDGIDIAGVVIKLTVLDPDTDIPGNKEVTLNVMDAVKSDITKNKKDISLVITQEIMAKALYGAATTEESLKDGMYKITITVSDDIKEKVVITPNLNTGDNPESIQTDAEYWFAVSTGLPEITIERPDDNAWGSVEPIDLSGTVKSRFIVRSLWITFTPNVVSPTSVPNDTSGPINLPRYADPACTIELMGGATVTADNDGYYTYYWKYENAVFNPMNGASAWFSTDLRRFTVEAYDRLGNMGSAARTVQIDSTGPEVTVSDYNHGRPPETENGVQVTYLYGKVSFTVSASDANGLYEVDGKSGIKWWVLKDDDPDPSWGTGFPSYTSSSITPNTWQGGGNFLLDQAINGRYTGIIDTRYLTDGGRYKLCVIALDKAGNQSYIIVSNPPLVTTNAYEKFTVDQSRDYPVIDENSLDPLQGQVKSQGAAISGSVSDGDLFNLVKRNTYVSIRFPKDTVTGKPAAAADWDDWININIPNTYSAAAGGIDPSGAIVYKFKSGDYSTPAAGRATTYLNKDGIKYYQIRVRDEPDEPTQAEKDNGAKNYGKNPDLFMNSNPLYPGYPYVYHDFVSIVFPLDAGNPLNQTPAESYNFIVDATYPAIFFDIYDPTEKTVLPDGTIIPHDGFSPSRPTFSTADLLIAALKGYVLEYKLSDMSMSWSATVGVGGTDTIFRKVILNNPPDDPANPGKYLWELDLTPTEKTDLETIFNGAPEGMQIIVFEATDMVPLTSRVSYIFAKDTKGPEINFNNISRSIKRNYTNTLGTASIPSLGDIPGNWPGDFRNGPVWKTDATPAWAALRTSHGLEYWSSDYALLASQKIIDALTSENGRNPSTIIGDPEGGSNPAVLEGSFSDEYSSVRITVPANNPDPTYFYYRFRDKTGKVISDGVSLTGVTLTGGVISVTDGWLQKEIEAAGSGQNEKTANWKITLDKANGFIGTDGENWVDIKVQDTAGNLSEIFNVRFIVDRAAPVLGVDPNPEGTTDADEFEIADIAGMAPPPWVKKALPEMQRVFSADGATGLGTDMAFTLEGTVSDFNLSSLTMTIGQEGYGYSVVASLGIDPTLMPGNSTGVTKNDADLVNGAPDPDGSKRLKVNAPTYSADDTPTWTWTLTIMQKDVKGLRDAAVNAADSARRYIRVTASDKANKRVGPVDWFFYLDTKKPKLDYANLNPGTLKAASSFEDNKLALSGQAEDDTRIKDVQFMIGRLNYATNAWNWYNAGSWTATQPTPHEDWPSVFTSDTVPTRQTTMNWTINQAALTAAGAKFPDGLFDQEGYYRLDLYITDFSLGSGNPHDTTATNDTTFMDAGYTGTSPNDRRSGRVFYIDKKDPNLQWGWVDWNGSKWTPDPADPVDSKKTYFKNETNGQVSFSFTVGDGNTIQYWYAEIKDSKGNELSSDSPSVKWQAGSDPTLGTTPTSTPIPTPADNASPTANVFSTTAIVDQKLIIKPFMTKDGKAGGTALDAGVVPLPTYTITITVKDGAGRSSSISKQFTLDNTPPRFIQDKFNPLSYKWKDDSGPAGNETINTPGYDPEDTIRSYSYDAVSGKMNIRGNTEDNSNQLKSVSYYVVNTDDSSSFTAFPTPQWVTNSNKWRYSGGTGVNSPAINTGASTTLIEIDQGTFAWKIMIPKTSLLLSEADGQKYVQTPKTGGTTINNTQYTATAYRDVASITETSVTMVNPDPKVPYLTFPDLATDGRKIYGGEDVGLITVYVRAEDAAGNVAYDLLKYWIWPEGDRPIVTSINNPDSTKIEADRLLNGTIRLSGMAKDNERVRYVWFRVLPSKTENGVTTITGAPYVFKEIPVWDEETWEAKPGQYQTAVNGSSIGARRSDDDIDRLGTQSPHGFPDGWYMANGGNSKEVSWWAYINTSGELDPQGGEEKREFTVEVRAQDVTYDEKNDTWMTGSAGMSSIPKRTSAWVVAGAPVFENAKVAPVDSNTAETSTPNKLWEDIDKLNIRKRSSYKVTVKHNSGLSSIRWSPTEWTATLNGGVGGFREAAPGTYNLLDLLALASYNETNPTYVYWNGSAYDTGTRSTVFTLLAAATGTNTNPRMAVTVKPYGMFTDNVSGLTTTKNYLILKWDDALKTLLPTSIIDDPSYYVSGTLKDLKNTIFKPTAASGSIGSAIIIEAQTEVVGSNNVDYYKWDVIVDARADILLEDMVTKDPAYGNGSPARAGQTKNSVRYPVYMSASEVSKANPLTSRGDALLPIDNLDPTGMYTLNRKVAGSAATIGGEAADAGPVNGIGRVVLWFQRGTSGISWHELPVTGGLGAGTFTQYTAGAAPNYISGGPVWWQDVTVPTGAVKPAIGTEANGSNGDSAIVIDTNSPSAGKPEWGHTLPMGFANGGSGVYWSVTINSYGITSGPVDLHYVVIDKAGNYKYYKERLVIMNGVAIISQIKLATDIRDNGALSFGGNRTGNTNGNTGANLAASPILNVIRNGVPLGGDSTDPRNDVKKGISDWVSSNRLGVNNIIDFNVRNNLFALRVETIDKPSAGKTRNFRLEYVSGARLLENTAAAPRTLAANMKAGRVYIINNPGEGATAVTWGSIGAEGNGPWQRGYAFIAAINGQEPDETGTNIDKVSGIGSVWELNPEYIAIGERTNTETSVPQYLRLGDVKYATAADPDAKGAEFVYGTNAFTGNTTAGNFIANYTNDTDAWPPAAGTNPVTGNSMFILRVFDGAEGDQFGAFTIIRVRVNNDDRTKPFAQLYDINPKTEGQERQNIAANNNEERRSVSPMFMGEGTGSNRTKGGLWNISPTFGAVEKPGHIEPRKIAYTITPYNTQQHSLSSAQMGGAAVQADATIQKPWANPAGFFAADTVSGRVVLRGYAEDDQRVHQVTLTIGGTNVTILDFQAHAAAGAGAGTNGNPDSSSTSYSPPLTGLLQIPAAQQGRVYFTDSIDAYRHRVEWAYIWDTETIPATVAGNGITVQVTAYNRTGVTTARKTASDTIAAPGTAHTAVSELTRPNTTPFNREFPVGLNKYNSISFNLRPYITGFLRNQAQFSHNTRSRQGRYMFYRGETAVITGFNLGTGTVSIPGAANIATANVGTIGDFGIITANNQRYRQFTVGNGATTTNNTGNNIVTYSFNSQNAVNTGNGADNANERRITAAAPIRPTYIQPWNIEYSPGIDGSQLWDDFTQVHIWQSDDVNAGSDRGRFLKGTNISVFDPSMSIDPATGTLWESHNEGGGNGFNSGSTKVSNNSGGGNLVVASFVDPIINSDIYVSTRPSGFNNNNNNYSIWTTFSIIGRSGDTDSWDDYGGVFVSGPQGGWPNLNSGPGNGSNSSNGFSNNNDIAARSHYIVESTGYNAGTNTNGATNWPPGNVDLASPSRNQFKTPHIVTDYRNNEEHIHVSYYDTKDHSLKYRYNRRGGYGAAISWGTAATANNLHYAWTNLDGDYDLDDENAFNAANNTNWANGTGGGWYRDPFTNYTAAIPQYGRVLNRGDTTLRSTDAGEYNSIALTRNGYPVIAYYDKANQKLKMAISSNIVPIAATNWTIVQDVLPSGSDIAYGTGEYVSMKIDTRGTTDIVHIAAMNAANKNLVYIQGTLSGTTFTRTKAQVVDSVGSVGRWCTLSLDNDGNPWISYQDESYQDSRDGVKLAYYNANTYYKGNTYRPGEDVDVNSESVTGWEAMHVPTAFRVKNDRLGMECYPVRNYTGTSTTKFWGGAVGFLDPDYFRAAYYVK